MHGSGCGRSLPDRKPAIPDPDNTYTLDEERRLAENLHALGERVHRGEFRRLPLTIGFLCQLHAALFGGVRAHAGQCRRPGFGHETRTFGPNRSVHRDQVDAELSRVSDELDRALKSFEANPEDPAYDNSALRLAAWVHAELIRIHPFEDGNGRTCRLFMNSVLVRLGLRPIAIDVPKQEYRECLNHYHKTREIQPLVDLCLRVYPLS